MLPVNVAVHDIELGERSQHGVRTAGMAVVGRAGDGSFHAEILLQIPAHVPIELTFRIHVESHFGGVAFLGGGGGLLPLERSEEHTSELQSLRHLVCRLLLEKKVGAALVAITARHAPSLAQATACSDAG